MTTKKALERILERISVHMLDEFNGSSDPQVFKLSGVICDAIQDVIDEMDE